MPIKTESKSRKRTVRMSDVAELANVSSMTVSRALRAPDTVADETRVRIQDAIERTGYIPNRLAGSLSSQHTNIIGLIVPSLRNSLFAETIQATADTLGKAGFHILIAESGHSLEAEESLIAAFLGQRVSGVMLHNTAHTDRARAMLKSAQIPVVETGDLARDPVDATVSYSNFDAAKAMTEYLFGRGYRRVGFVSLDLDDNDRMRERRAGYAAALSARGVAYDEALVCEVPPGLAGGRDGLRKLLDDGSKPDAIFFVGDVLAVGAALECERRGISIPNDVAIASFDDLDILEHLVPRITALRLPRREVGIFAAEEFLERILGTGLGPGQGTDQGAGRKDLGFDIIQREST